MSFENVIVAPPPPDQPRAAPAPRLRPLALQLGGPSAMAFPTADPELVQLARSLRYDPDLIFEYVHNNITTLPQYGSLKGPLGTLLDGCGTAADQAELMAVLLQLSGIAGIKFVVGRISIEAAQFTAWLGTDTSLGSVGTLLATGGLDPFVLIDQNNQVIRADVNWAWVKATIDGTAYVFDPATKSYARKAGVANMATLLGYNRSTFLGTDAGGALDGATVNANDIANINRANVRMSVAGYAGSLVTALRTQPQFAGAGPEDILGGASIVPLAINTRRRDTTLSYAISSTDYDDVPASVRTTLTVTVPGASSAITLNSSDIYGRRLSLFFNASIAPVLALDGVVLRTGTAVTSGSLVTLTFSIDHPYPSPAVDQSGTQQVQATAGGAFVVSTGWGPVGRAMIERHRQILQKNTAANPGNPSAEPVLGESLAMLGYAWLAQVSRTQQLAGQLGNTFVLYQHAVGIVGMSPSLPPANVTAPYVDLPFNFLGVIQRTGRPQGGASTEQEAAAFFALIQLSSVLESGAIEQTQPGLQAVSTVKLLDVANSQAQKIYDFNSVAVFDALRPQLLNYTTGFLDGLRSSINAGARIIMHQNGQIQQDLWKGFGYFDIRSVGSGTSIGAIISGGYNGGFATTNWPPPELNFFADLTVSTPSITPLNTLIGFSGPDSYGLLPTGGDPLNLVTGDYFYAVDDLTVGNGPFPYTLAFQRSYDSGRSASGTTMGRGWRHGFDLSVTPDSDGFEGMAATSAAAGAVSIASIFTMLDILNNPGGEPLPNVAVAALVGQYWMEQLTGNVLRVARPGAVESFVRLPDATWNPPIGSSAELSAATPAGPYTLRTGDGLTLQFAAGTPGEPGRITTWQSAAGALVTFTYVGGKLVTVGNNLGRTLTLGYTGDVLTSVLDGNGRSVGFIYDGAGRLERVTNPLGDQTVYTYDAGGRLASIFYPSFPTDAFVTNTYDELGRVIEQRDGRGNLTTVYVAGRRTELAEPSGNRHVWYFDPLGKAVLDVQDYGRDGTGALRLNLTTATTYDGQSRPIRTTLPEGNAVETKYNRYSNPIEIKQIDKAGTATLTQEFTYTTPDPDPARSNFERVLTSKDARGNVTDYEYTPIKGTLTKVRQPAVTKPGVTGTVRPETTYTYTTVGLVQQETDPEGRVTAYEYDAAGNRTAQVVDSGTGRLNLRTTWTYDAVGNALTRVRPRGNVSGATPASFTTTYVYDSKRRLTSESEPGQILTQYFYDKDDRTTVVRRRLLAGSPPTVQNTTTAYTTTGKVLRVTDASAVRVTYTYDSADRVLFETSTSGRRVSYVYDVLSRVITVTDTVAGTLDPSITENRGAVVRERRTYTNNGLLFSVRDGNNNLTRYLYDGFDRLRQIDYPDAPDDRRETYVRDENGNITRVNTRAGLNINMTYDALNRRITRAAPANANAPAVSYTYGYDLTGRPLQVGQSIDAAPIKYGYDTAGRLLTEEDSAGRVLTYAYDADGNRLSLTWPTSGSETPQMTVEYDDRGRTFRIFEAGQRIAAYTYDLLSRRTSALYHNLVTSTWTWRINDTLASVAHAYAGGAGVTFEYRYNTENGVRARLVSDATYQAGAGNPALAVGTQGYTVNALNQYTAVAGTSLTYDNDGNLSGDGTWTYGHDAQGRLVSAAKAGTTIGYGYDAVGRRRSRTVNAVTTTSLWSGDQEVAEYDAAGALVRRFVWGPMGVDEILAIIGVTGSTAARRRFQHADGLGTVVAATLPNGTLEAKFAYTPYGVADSNAGPPWRFTGRRLDPDTGLYYLRARDYSPLLGRFIQPDPIGMAGGINLYAYVGNSPLNYTDPSGKFVPLLVAGGIGAIGGAASGYFAGGWRGAAIGAGVGGLTGLGGPFLGSAVGSLAALVGASARGIAISRGATFVGANALGGAAATSATNEITGSNGSVRTGALIGAGAALLSGEVVAFALGGAVAASRSILPRFIDDILGVQTGIMSTASSIADSLSDRQPTVSDRQPSVRLGSYFDGAFSEDRSTMQGAYGPDLGFNGAGAFRK